MLRILLPVLAMLAACAPSPEKAAMRSPTPVSGTTVQSSSAPNGSVAPSERRAGNPDPGAVAKGAAAKPLAGSPAEALGRRILSTAFVRVGPDGHLTVELHDGHVLVLRNVIMRSKDFCGAQVAGEPARTKYCGGYAEVAAARPGGAPAVSNPLEAERGPAKGK